MRKTFAMLTALLLAFVIVMPASAQHGQHGNFRQGAYNGGWGGSYDRGHDRGGRYQPGGIGPGKGAAIGAGAGAALGLLFGGGLKGAVVGGAAGAGIGAVAGQANQNNQRRDCYRYGNC